MPSQLSVQLPRTAVRGPALPPAIQLIAINTEFFNGQRRVIGHRLTCHPEHTVLVNARKLIAIGCAAPVRID